MDYSLDLAVRLQQKRVFRGCGTAPSLIDVYLAVILHMKRHCLIENFSYAAHQLSSPLVLVRHLIQNLWKN
jgi:hypothetical protein